MQVSVCTLDLSPTKIRDELYRKLYFRENPHQTKFLHCIKFKKYLEVLSQEGKGYFQSHRKTEI